MYQKYKFKYLNIKPVGINCYIEERVGEVRSVKFKDPFPLRQKVDRIAFLK